MKPEELKKRAWLQAQYDNRARVQGSAQILARWVEQSAAARSALNGRLEVPYGAAPTELLDVFPAPRAGAPVLVFIHGGWWRSLGKGDHSFVAPDFVRAGAAVVVPDYDLCPAVRIDDIALQMTRALAWVWHNAATFGGDPRRIILAGHSAGGHLAALLLNCDWQRVDAALPGKVVQGALAISGVFDLEPLRQTPFLQADLRLTRASARRLSPVHMPAPRVPLQAVAGADESEEFGRHVAMIRRAWGARAVPVSEQVPGLNHFTVLDDFARPGTRVHGLARGLLGLA
jgi:arylformamidase